MITEQKDGSWLGEHQLRTATAVLAEKLILNAMSVSTHKA